MKVEANKVVTFHYTVSDETGKLESSRDREEPPAFLVGHGGLVPGLEKALDGRESGEHFEVAVAPADAYGERRADFTQRVPKKYFRDPDHLRPGMVTVLGVQGGGHRQVTVEKVGLSGGRILDEHLIATIQVDDPDYETKFLEAMAAARARQALFEAEEQ